MAAVEHPDALKLRPRELFFLLVGTTGGAGGAVFWFRLAPMLMKERGLEVADLSALGHFVLGGGFAPAVLILTALLLAGGYATRTTLGKDRATWIFAAGASVSVLALMLTMYAVGDPLFTPDPVAESDLP
jgi:hypothetical protein